MNCGRVRSVLSRRVLAGLVTARCVKETAPVSGTGSDQRGGGGMGSGLEWQCGAWRGELRFGCAMSGDVGSVAEWLATTLVQARGWINASGVGCTKEWCGGSMLVMARHGEFP